MASIKQLDERRYKITVSNGYRPNGKKISKAKTIQVPSGVPKRGIGQYVVHAAEELERSFKTGYAEDGEMTFEEFASRWLNRQTKYAPSTIAAYRRMLEVVYPIICNLGKHLFQHRNNPFHFLTWRNWDWQVHHLLTREVIKRLAGFVRNVSAAITMVFSSKSVE